MLKPNESRNLKKQYKRILIFLSIFFVFALVLCYLLMLAGISPVLNGFIIIVCASIFYLLFLFICAKIDKRKARKQLEDPTKDPFTKKK